MHSDKAVGLTLQYLVWLDCSMSLSFHKIITDLQLHKTHVFDKFIP